MIPPINTADLAVTNTADVCIIGAGAAGVSAAVAAARCGLSILVIDGCGFAGGAAVAGLSGTICGLFNCGEAREQLVFGFADEFYQALRQRQGVTEPVSFGKTWLVPHDAFCWKRTADDFLLDHRCTILYHTQFIQAKTSEDGYVTHLLLKGMEGFFLVKTRFVIDASGDAALVHSLGGATYFGNNGTVQTPTMIFRMGNVDTGIFGRLSPDDIVSKVTAAHQSGRYHLPRHHVYIFPLPHVGEVLCNMTRITYPDGQVPLGTSSADMTFAEIEGRRQAQEYARFLVTEVEGFENAYLSDTGCQVGIRQTRSIVGLQQLKNDHVVNGAKQSGAVCLSAWPIELHSAAHLKIHYLINDYYTIPFEAQVPVSATNFLVAGRCLSAEHEALASARVTAQCFGMGYAAGAAAALALQENITANGISGPALQQWMKSKKLKNAYEK